MIFSEGLQNQKEFYMQGRKLTMCDSLMTKARTLAPISMEACCCQRLQLFDVHSFWFAKLWNAQGFFQPLVFFSLNHLLFSVMRYLLPWCGGPDNTQRSSFDQMWSSNLRPDEAFDDRLPEAWYFKVKMLVNFRMPVFSQMERQWQNVDPFLISGHGGDQDCRDQSHIRSWQKINQSLLSAGFNVKKKRLNSSNCSLFS